MPGCCTACKAPIKGQYYLTEAYRYICPACAPRALKEQQEPFGDPEPQPDFNAFQREPEVVPLGLPEFHDALLKWFGGGPVGDDDEI